MPRKATTQAALSPGRLILPLVRRRLPGIKLEATIGGYGAGSTLQPTGYAEDARTIVEACGRGAQPYRRRSPYREQWQRLDARRGRRFAPSGGDRYSGGLSSCVQGFNKDVQLDEEGDESGVEVERDTTGRLVPEFYQIYLA
jgi:hypothetical protein